MKLLVDFWQFPSICTTWSLNCFCFDFLISAEQFYDRNKQVRGKTRNKQTMPCQMMAQVSNNISVSWRLSCKCFYGCFLWRNFLRPVQRINRGKRTSRIWEKHDVYLPHLVSNIGVIHLNKLRWYKFKLFWQMECHTISWR